MSDSQHWPADFGPSFTPEQMLSMGVFEGRYIGAISGEPSIPKSYFNYPNVLSGKDKKQFPPNDKLNYYAIKSRQPLSVWADNGWLTKHSPNGWFEWYIKFCLGRRLGEVTIHSKSVNEDRWQINRWRSFVARHMGQIHAHCTLTDKSCHTKQRQGLLQWGWDSEHHTFTDDRILKNAKKMASTFGCRLEAHPSGESILSMNW